MPLLTWTPSFSVGIQSIDLQHQRLVEMINNLHEAMAVGKGKDAVGPILDGLVEYAQVHFAMEEKLMQKYNYLEYRHHKDEHDEFVKKVGALQKQYQTTSVGLTVPVMQFLKEWLTNHIMGTDKRYIETFRKNGVV